MVRLPAALALLLVTLPLTACGAKRGAGAGDLTVTSRAAAPQAAHAHARRDHARGERTGTSFARVALRGTSHTLLLPRGWGASLYAHVSGARLEAWSPQRTLLVSSPDSGTVVELTPRRHGPPTQRTIITGLTLPQGLAFDRHAGRTFLYVAASDALYRYTWTARGTAVARSTTVADLPDAGPAGADVHRLKNVVADGPDTLFLDIGSASNASIPTATRPFPRASVIEIHPYARGGVASSVYATGIRNGDGLAIAPDGTLWTAVNERDQIAYPFHRGYGGSGDAHGQVITAYVNDHPPDEVAELTRGRNLGWPYCDPDPDTHPGSATTGYRSTDLPFTPDAQTNPGSRRLDCARLSPLQVGLPAHSAPLGLHFLTGSTLPARWRAGAVVAGHGSWDRQPPRAPVVYWMPWEARRHTLGAPITLISGFQDADGTRWGRLADAVPGPGGSLYVTDDVSGAVYRITP